MILIALLVAIPDVQAEINAISVCNTNVYSQYQQGLLFHQSNFIPESLLQLFHGLGDRLAHCVAGKINVLLVTTNWLSPNISLVLIGKT
jgi:hypothetical protein